MIYNGFEIEIRSDDFATDPREWDHLGTMVCFHSRYKLGDKHDFNEPNEFRKFAKQCIYLPLYLYDHGGVTMNTTGFSCPWDSGQVGWIYVTKKHACSEYGWKCITKKHKERILEILKSEVTEYNYYLTGEVYGYNIDGLDSCYGFYGDPETSGLLEQAKEVIDNHNSQLFEVPA